MLNDRFYSLVRRVLKGEAQPGELARFVLKSGDIRGCNEVLGDLQLNLGASPKGLRILDAQLLIKLAVQRKLKELAYAVR